VEALNGNQGKGKKGVQKKESLAELRKRILSQGQGGAQAAQKPKAMAEPGKKPSGIFGFRKKPEPLPKKPAAQPKAVFKEPKKRAPGLKPFIGTKGSEKKAPAAAPPKAEAAKSAVAWKRIAAGPQPWARPEPKEKPGGKKKKARKPKPKKKPKKPKPVKKPKPLKKKAAKEPKPVKKPKPVLGKRGARLWAWKKPKAKKAFPARRLKPAKPIVSKPAVKPAVDKVVPKKPPAEKPKAVPVKKAPAVKAPAAKAAPARVIPVPWWKGKAGPMERVPLPAKPGKRAPLHAKPVARAPVPVVAKKWVVPSAGKPSAEERISTIKQKIVEAEKVKRQDLFVGAEPSAEEAKAQGKPNFRLYLIVGLVLIFAVSSVLFFVFMVFFQPGQGPGGDLPPGVELEMPPEMAEALARGRTASVEKTSIVQSEEPVPPGLVSEGGEGEAGIFESFEGLLQVSFQINERNEATIHSVSRLEEGRITVTPAGDYSVQLLDAKGKLLYELPFNAVFVIMSDPPTRVERIKFSFVIPSAESADRVAIAKDRLVLAEKKIE